MDILSMQNVSLSFGSTRALDGLSFAVKEGEIFGFLGPSGAGKPLPSSFSHVSSGPAQLPVFLLVCTAGSITMLLLGGLTGIVFRDQTSTGTIAGPLALVFMLPTMFAGMGGVLQKVASFVPTTATADLMFLGPGRQSWMGANVLWDVAVLAVWTAGSAVLFALAFRKKGVDN